MRLLSLLVNHCEYIFAEVHIILTSYAYPAIAFTSPLKSSTIFDQKVNVFRFEDVDPSINKKSVHLREGTLLCIVENVGDSHVRLKVKT